MALVLLLSGCVAERLRADAQERLRAGDYEAALDSLEAGQKEHPDSALLRSGTLSARNEALSRLLTEAAAERALGRLDAAEALLKRALRFDTGGKRVEALLADVAVERRQRQALAQAESLAAQQPQAALLVINTALKDNPRQADLLALKRRLEAQQRQSQTKAMQQGLNEARPISLDFRDANLRTVLDVVSRNSGINFVLDKDVRADVRVSVYLRSARLEDAIDLITSTHGLAKKLLDGQTMLIYPNTPEKQREYQEQVIRVFHLASAEAKGAAAFLRSMLKLKEPFVDERSNMLALRETPENIELAERLLALYDTPEPEVVLELEVIEVRSSRLLDLGVKFPDTLSLTPLGPTGAAGGITAGNIESLTRNNVSLSFGGVLLNFKREIGDFNTLANPASAPVTKRKPKCWWATKCRS
ncbi:secretin N-terminal domain-containing protein [Ideonella paludis]|uniref:secretin N-terminal domain-containing protein n=1 Tax=Ideonella paludis TaxID=1233411 RepID=UPI0036425F70